MVAESEISALKYGRPPVKWRGGRPPMELEKILEGIFHRLRNAGPWRDFPAEYGSWRTLYGWYQWFAQRGIMLRIFRLVAKAARGKLRLVDGTFIPVHQCASNPRGGAQGQQMGKTKGGRNTKLMAMVEGQGLPVALILVPGQAYEGKYVVELITQEGSSQHLIIVGDKAYDDDKLRAKVEALCHRHCFPTRRNRREDRPMNRAFYRKRFRVENFFGKLKRWGSTATRRDKLAVHFNSLIAFAAVLEWLRA